MAQVDMFMKIVGTSQGRIRGESTDAKHAGEIEIDSFSWDIIQPYDKATGLGSGRRQHGLFKFVMKTQVATPLLLTACSTGEHLKEAVLTCRKAGKDQQEYMKWTLKDALITHIETGYDANDADDIVPSDEVSLAFNYIEVQYQQQKPDGTLGGAVVFVDDLGGQ